ncbi:DNA repair protein Rad60 [Polyergus mexicanus]|uniref:DNA repair protein Rad60 n=1 Tax=Polyergus mexicanus TaxID=615972 RepID=UPI0038B62A6A
MDNMTSDISSDEDDPYANFASRLKALKEKREKLSEEIENFSIDIKQQKNSEEETVKEINGKETNGDDIQIQRIQRRMVRSKRNEGITTRATVRQTRGRHPPVDNLEYDVEIVSMEEKSKSIPETCNNDVIALSDDEFSIKDDNYEMNIKVFWRSNRIDRLNMHRHDNFQGVFQYYADLEKVSVNEILIMKKDKIVNRTDTPASLKLSVIDILDGGIVHPNMNTLSEDKNNDEDNDDICTIKIQTANKKQSLTIPLKKDQQFRALFSNCAEKLGIKESNLKFYFDGEQIRPIDTPELLDLEGEACIDLHIST